MYSGPRDPAAALFFFIACMFRRPSVRRIGRYQQGLVARRSSSPTSQSASPLLGPDCPRVAESSIGRPASASIRTVRAREQCCVTRWARPFPFAKKKNSLLTAETKKVIKLSPLLLPGAKSKYPQLLPGRRRCRPEQKEKCAYEAGRTRTYAPDGN